MKKEIQIVVKIDVKTIITSISILMLVVASLLIFREDIAHAREVYKRSNNPMDYLTITMQKDQQSLTVVKQNFEREGGQLTLEHPFDERKNVHLDLYVDGNKNTFFRIHSRNGVIFKKLID